MFFSLFCCPAIWVQSMVSWWMLVVVWTYFWAYLPKWDSLSSHMIVLGIHLSFCRCNPKKYPKTTSSPADPHLTTMWLWQVCCGLDACRITGLPPKDEDANTRPASGRRPAVKGGEMRPVDHHPCLMAGRSEFSQKWVREVWGKGFPGWLFREICALQLCLYMSLLLKQKNVFVFCIYCVNIFIYTYDFELLQFVWCQWTIIYLFTYIIVWYVFPSGMVFITAIFTVFVTCPFWFFSFI